MEKYRKYLDRKHDYFNINCITLIAEIYEKELHRDDFKLLWEYLGIKDGHPEHQTRWWKYLKLKKYLFL